MKSAKQKKVLKSYDNKLYNNSSLWHPDDRSEKLIELVMKSSDIITRVDSTLSSLRAFSISSETPSLFKSLKTKNEQLRSTFGIIVFSISDLKVGSTLLTQAMESVSPSHKGKGVDKTSLEVSGISATPHVLCIQATILVMTVVKRVLNRINRALGKLQKYQDIIWQDKLRICESQLTALIEYALPCAMEANPEEIFYKSPDDPVWNRLKRHYSVYDDSSSSFETAYKDWEEGLKIIEASCKYSLQKEGHLSSFLTTGLNLLYYSIFSQKARHQGELFFVEADSNFFFKFWNITERNPYINYIYKKGLPSVKFHQVIYVPKMLVSLSPENLTKRQMQKNVNIDPRFSIRRKSFDPTEHVKIRITSEATLPVDFENNRKRSRNEPRIKTVIVHIHGGGFVASTSRGHQHYIRKWANMVPDCVIMSIDYRLAPEFPYPAGLDDICQGYYWILTQCWAQLGINPKNIILVGDSAGGNFAMGLVLRCIHTGLRIPDGLLLAYPVRSFTPSLLISVDDSVLQFNFMISCIKSYVQDCDPAADPYISPALISDDDLAKFPPVRLIISGRDPLRDESYKLLHRLVYLIKNSIEKYRILEKDVHLKEYRKFPHGLWTLAAPYGIEDCKYAVSDAAAWIKELVAKHEEKLKRIGLDYTFKMFRTMKI